MNGWTRSSGLNAAPGILAGAGRRARGALPSQAVPRSAARVKGNSPIAVNGRAGSNPGQCIRAATPSKSNLASIGGQRRCCLGRNRRANLPRAAYYRYYLFASAPCVRLACTPRRPPVCFALRADTGPRPLQGALCMRWRNKCAAYNGRLCSAYRFINAYGRLIDSHAL